MWRTGETTHPRFGGMQRETIFGQPLWEDRHEALGITFHRAHDHEVIGKAVQSGFPIEPWCDHRLEPGIEDGMEKDIRHDRRHPRALRYPSVRVRYVPVLKDTSIEPLVNRATDDPVTYPLIQDASEMVVVEAIKRAL
jgi:hypothetical protein